METTLTGRRVAILIANGFEESEFQQPYEALKRNGAAIDVISIKPGTVKSWTNKNWGKDFPVDKGIDEAKAEDYDALVLPGGVHSPDQLRMNKNVVEFVKYFMEESLPVAAICHGPWTLIETGLLKGRTVTSYPSIKTDLVNAGAKWVDEEVVVDNGLVTSRKPGDLPAFCEKMIEEIAEGIHN